MSGEVKSYDVVREAGAVHLADLGYAVVYKVFDYRIEVEVYETAEMKSGDGTVEVMYPKGNFWVTDPGEADVFLEGYVKWDGCSNWDFHPSDKGVAEDGKSQCRHMHHFCDREGLVNVGMLLSRIYDLATKIPHWSD